MAASDYYQNWKRTNDGAYLQYFKNCATSLVDHLRPRFSGGREFSVWEHDYPFSYGMQPPWISGLAQGVGVQVLSRAYKVTGEEQYLKAAERVLESFFVEVRNGGVTYKESGNAWWYEEYAKEGAPESRVLNGMVYALIGLHEYYNNTGNEAAKMLFEKGLRSLKNNLSRYDAGWWTFYSELGVTATKSYHSVHLDLMRQLYAITSDPVFLQAYEKWSRYTTPFFVREFIRQKPSWHDLTILGLATALSGIFLEGVLVASFLLS